MTHEEGKKLVALLAAIIMAGDRAGTENYYSAEDSASLVVEAVKIARMIWEEVDL